MNVIDTDLFERPHQVDGKEIVGADERYPRGEFGKRGKVEESRRNSAETGID